MEVLVFMTFKAFNTSLGGKKLVENLFFSSFFACLTEFNNRFIILLVIFCGQRKVICLVMIRVVLKKHVKL